MEKGYLAIVLHAHLPYVRHPEYSDFLEEDWLYEAITETYIPLIEAFENLINDNVDFRITMSFSSTLASMLADNLLQNRYIDHLDKLIELTDKEINRTKWENDFNRLAHMYHEKFLKCRYFFVDKYKKNILNAFKAFADAGKIELICCAGTHGFLPLMDNIPEAVNAQVSIAVSTFEKLFGRKPLGMWLPECAYLPGHEEVLKKNGIRYFFLETHGLLHATPRPKYGIFAPVYCKNGVAAFGRDTESSRAVWSAKEGYPGEYDYREFYRDIGFDLNFDYIRPYIHSDGIRVTTGIKYYRITGPGNHKEPYNPDWAIQKAADHAGNFMYNREKQLDYLNSFLSKKPIIVSPFDAELFGHWWYEGPKWIEFLFRKIHHDQDTIRLITPSEYLRENPANQIVTPSASTWGWKGYNEVWLCGANDWIYRHLHKAAERMVELANNNKNAEGVKERVLNQAARELLLLQSSDWAFMMKTGQAVEYAVKITKDHLARFTRLYNEFNSGKIDEFWLLDIEYKDNIFPDINFRIYCS